MTALWYRDNADFEIGGKHFFVNCDVRNELNGRRPKGDPKQIVRAIVNGKETDPYMPRQFPKGICNVTSIEYYPRWRKDQVDYWPLKIKTDAQQKVELWALDKNGGYDHPTGVFVMDSAYYVHYCEWSKTTLGCGRAGIDSWNQAHEIAEIMIAEFLAGGEVLIDVR